MLKSEQVTPFIADAYREAALAAANMRAATETLEAMRVTMLSESDLLLAWDKLDAQVNQAADARGLQPVLVGLREQWKKIILHDECERLKGIFERDPALGWIGWLHTFVDALTKFRLDFCKQLCEAPLPFPPDVDPSISQIRLFTDRTRHARWAEAFDLYAKLGEQEKLMPNLRARLLAIASEIVVYHFYQFERAKAILERAQSLAPDEWRVTFSWGNYYMQQPGDENRAKAKECYQRLIEIVPDESVGYTGVGECLEREGDLAGAEEKYRQAAKCPVSPVDGYSSLLKLLGQKAIFEERKETIPDLVARFDAVALRDSGVYESRLAAGDAYKANDRLDEAHEWYQRAIEFDPSRIGGYVAEAYLWLDNKDYAKAEEYFRRAIEVAPEALDGYWGMSWVAEERQDWEAALKWCEESLKYRTEWAVFIHARAGQIKLQLKQAAEATDEFFKALAIDPNNNDAMNGIGSIASDSYKSNGDAEAALQLYRRLREAAGESYEGTYRNEIGNVHYYFGRHKEAADEYRAAIAADSKEPRFYSNLALAFERFMTPGSRIEEVDEAIRNARTAHELQPESAEYAEQVAELERERAFVARYGEHALTLEPVYKPIGVRVESEALPIILNAEQDNLSEDVLSLIEALRERIRDRFGLTIPGINFTTLELPGAHPRDYQIDLLGERAAYGQLETSRKFAFGSEERLGEFQIEGEEPYVWPESDGFAEGFWLDEADWEKAASHNVELIDAREYLLRHVEFVVPRHLDKLFGHQETANLLAERETGAGAEVERDPRKLNALTLKLKDILKRGEAVADLAAICEEVNRSSSGGAATEKQSEPERSSSESAVESAAESAAESAPGITSLTLHLSRSSPLERENLAQEFVNLQDLLFDELGVIIPQVTIAEDDSVGEHDFQLQANDRELAITPGLAPGEFWINIPFDDVKDLHPGSRASVEPNFGTPAAILKDSANVQLDYAGRGYSTRDPLGYVIFSVAAELRRRANELLTAETVEHYLSKLEVSYPALVKVARHYFSAEELTRRLREPLSNGKSIRNMTGTLETLLEAVN